MNTFDLTESPVKMQPSRKYFITAISIGAICAALYLYPGDALSPHQENTSTSHAGTPPIGESAINHNDAIQTPPTTNVDQKTETPLFTAQDSDDRDVWAAKHGYYHTDDVLHYQSYTDAQLYDLGMKGDLIAFQTLGGKMIASGQADAAIPYFHEAAALGSTVALLQIANTIDRERVKGETAEMIQQSKRAAAIESMAIIKTAELRGDIRLAGSLTGPLSLYQINHGPINLSQTEKAFIDQRAKAIYDRLQERRTALGLGDFDNSTPKLDSLVYGQRNKQ